MASSSRETTTEDKEALKKLVLTIPFVGFVVDDVLNNPEFSGKEVLTIEEVKNFGYAVVRSTELIATSVARGDWGLEDEQELHYAGLIRPWLETLDTSTRDYLFTYLYG